MEYSEYETMYRVEDHHWWYGALDGILEDAWRRYTGTGGGRARVLDVGCGTGRTLARSGEVAEAFGIDPSEEALRLCRSRGPLRCVRARAEALPFADACFDAAISLDVLSHQTIRDKAQPLAEVRRVLRRGGYAYLNVPAYQWLRSSHDDAVHMDRRFTRGEMALLLDRAGLELAWASYWNTLLLPPIAALRLCRRARPARGSDLARSRGGPGNALGRLSAWVERHALRLSPLPFGVSLFVVARKP